ncbi:hypothetical protein [Mucilaginibacter phyllosphaerae]
MTSNKKHTALAALVAIFSLMNSLSASAQKWLPGYFIDVKGIRTSGYIYPNPGGRGPIKDEGFIAFRDEENATPYYLSTSDLQCFVAGQDSFVVAHAPGNETWAKKEFDFVRVAVNGDVKIYATRGAGSGGGGKKVQVAPALGIGTGTYGTSYGGGIGINIGGNGGGGSNKLSYYYGSSTATMKHLTNENFKDVMSEAMADEPEVVEQIRNNLYGIKNIEKLIAYFNKLQASIK